MTRVFVGQRDGTLAMYAMNESGALSRRAHTQTGDFPSFAAMAPSGETMVVVNEASDEVVSLRVTASSLQIVSRVGSEGSGPTHVSVHPRLDVAYVANYGDGSVAAFSLRGPRIERAIDVERAGENAHEVVVDPSGRWLLVPCKGDDRVVVFAIGADGSLTRRGSHETAAHAGPRHLAFDRAGSHAYLANETASTVDVLAFDAEHGTLQRRQTLSTLPDSFDGRNTASEILLSPNGENVYVSNRGNDSIARFAVGSDGMLSARGHAQLEARAPRSMALDPSGHFLIVGAYGSDRLVRFAVSEDGSLTRLGGDEAARPWFVGAFATK